MDAPLVEIRDAVVVQDGRTLLRIDRFALKRGERLCVLGPNGAGKSTFVRLLIGETLPVHGAHTRVLVDGEPLVPLFELRRRVGVVSDALQSSHERPLLVEHVVLSGFFGSIGLHRIDDVTEEMRRAAERAMEDVGIAHLSGRTMDTLSTGEARRALIARALVHRPQALVLDEPCHGLDLAAAWRFRRTLSSLARSERALVLVTHHIEDVIPEIERVVLMNEGSIVADGPKAEILTTETLSRFFDIPLSVDERDGVYRVW